MPSLIASLIDASFSIGFPLQNIQRSVLVKVLVFSTKSLFLSKNLTTKTVIIAKSLVFLVIHIMMLKVPSNQFLVENLFNCLNKPIQQAETKLIREIA